ncbi:hypothetical protein BY996DRAFT_6504292 [Phakopsora pachyrhizi]|nr:hypothetical protein BY996DRAFT_6504292 [Phakopsora pachyrhizi]
MTMMPQINCGTKPRGEGGNLNNGGENDEDQVQRVNINLCRAYDLLAEVHQESERFKLAIELYRDSLKIEESALMGLSVARLLADNHLMFALAFEMIPRDPTSWTASIENIERVTGQMRGCLAIRIVEWLADLEIRYEAVFE